MEPSGVRSGRWRRDVPSVGFAPLRISMSSVVNQINRKGHRGTQRDGDSIISEVALRRDSALAWRVAPASSRSKARRDRLEAGATLHHNRVVWVT